MLPELFHIGSLPIHSWGVLLMLGFLHATWRAARNAWRYQQTSPEKDAALTGLTPEDVWDIALLGLVGGVIGARLAYVGLNIPYFTAHPGEIFAIWTGGMTFYGGLAGGIIAGVLACRAKKVVVGDMADLAAVSFPIGYFWGRVGCFLNGCCYGGLCPVPWLAVRFHLPNGEVTPPSHPAQLYSAVISLLMYLVLLPIEKSRAFRGQIILAYAFLYGVYRFLIEFVREGATADVTGILGLTQGQVASLTLSLVTAVIYAVLLSKKGSKTTSVPPKAPELVTPSTLDR
jgi:phosphatidylglycerol:prolipoprotein diacylglycerol transferase